MEEKGKAILETVEAENRIAILMVGRPYHSDPGLNHGIPEEFQVLGYPILSMRSIPRTSRVPARYFKDEIARGPAPARHQRRVAGELLGQQRAEGVGGEVRGAAPERGAARPVELQVRPRRADLRLIVESIVSAARRRTRRSTTSTRTSPAGRSRSACKTYAHSLKLTESGSRTCRGKKAELGFRIEQKRIELLEMKAAQLAERSGGMDRGWSRRSPRPARAWPRTRPRGCPPRSRSCRRAIVHGQAEASASGRPALAASPRAPPRLRSTRNFREFL
jgi:hypothetical protein